MATAEGGGSAATAEGARFQSRWSQRRYSVVLPALLLTLSGCVYFNTYYNAQKHFRQAEKARLEAERERRPAKAATQRGDQPSRRRPSRTGESYHSLYEKALRGASVVLEKHPESELVDDAMFLAGRSLYWQSDYFYAARSFRDLEMHFPDSEYYDRARYWRGLCLEQQGIAVEARRVFEALFEEGIPGIGARAGFRLGELAAAEQDYLAAITEYRATLARYPGSRVRAETLLRLGEAHLGVDDEAHQDSALAVFAAVAAAGPDDKTSYRARLNRGMVLYELGRGDEALEVYTGLLRESRFREYEGETRLLLGRYYWDLRDLDRALSEYEQVRDDFPQTSESAMALYWTGMLHLREYGERLRGQEYLEEVPKENRNSEASLLAQEMLGTLNEVDRLRLLVARADSLNEADRLADSTAAATADTVAAAADTAAGDSAAGPTAAETGARRGRGRGDPRENMLDNLFGVAELYRDKLVLPDSAAYFYDQIVERFPETPELPRALYSLAWIRLDMMGDADGAEPILRRLIDEFPETTHAQGARQLLGVSMAETAERLAAERFAAIEARPTQSVPSQSALVDGLDSLVAQYPQTPTAARAAYLAAWTCENALGDTAASRQRYAGVVERFPSSPFASLVRQRQQADEQGTVAKLERSLRSMGEGVKSGERLVTIAVEPDSADSASLGRKFLGFALRAHRAGRLQAAEELYESTLEQRPGDSRALYGMGDIRWRASYFEDAVDYLRQALRQGASGGEAAGMLGSYYRLFSYFVRSGQADSSNHYLREVLRRDRDNPDTASLLDEYPRFAGAEPEDLDMSVLEDLQVVPPESLLEIPVRGLGLAELPLVRTSVRPRYPASASGDSAVVVLDVLIDEEGLPESVAVFAGDEPYAGAAEEAARRYVFYAGEDGRGEPLRVWVELEIPVFPAAGSDTTAAAVEVAGVPPPGSGSAVRAEEEP